MRILHLAPPADAHNGIADYARHWRDAMQGSGAELVCPPLDAGLPPLLEALDQHRIEWIHAELGGGRVAEFEALRQLRQLRPELGFGATVHDPERLIWRAAQLPGSLAWLAACPGPMPQLAGLLDHRRVLRMERRLARQLDALVCMTRRGSEALARRMQLAAGLSYTIAHGNISVPPRPLPPGPLRLLYFGYIYPGKGIEDLLQALAGLRAKGGDQAMSVRLTLAGGTAPDIAFGARGSYVQSLRQQIHRHQLDHVVDWQTDVPGTEIIELIQAHHVMVLPYRESRKLAWLGQMRSTSGALAWATACGRGAIVSDARAFAEEISHGNGCQFRHRDPADLQRRLETLTAQPSLADEWARHAGQLAVERQWPRIAEQYMTTFTQALQRRHHD